MRTDPSEVVENDRLLACESEPRVSTMVVCRGKKCETVGNRSAEGQPRSARVRDLVPHELKRSTWYSYKLPSP